MMKRIELNSKEEKKNRIRKLSVSTLATEQDDEKDKDFEYSMSDQESSSSEENRRVSKKKEPQEKESTPYELKVQEEQKHYAEELIKRNARAEEQRKRFYHFIGDYSSGVVLDPPNPVLWGYYSDLKDIENLIEYLDERGSNESQLKTNLIEKFPKIVSLTKMREKELEELESNQKSNRRKKSNAKAFNFLSYSNTD